MAAVSRSFITAAISRHHTHPQCSVANGDLGKQALNLMPPDPSLAELVKSAWLPTIAGQPVPIQGLERPHVPRSC